MAYLMLFLAIAVAVLVLVGLRMLIGLSVSFMASQERQTPITVPSHSQNTNYR